MPSLRARCKRPVRRRTTPQRSLRPTPSPGPSLACRRPSPPRLPLMLCPSPPPARSITGICAFGCNLAPSLQGESPRILAALHARAPRRPLKPLSDYRHASPFARPVHFGQSLARRLSQPLRLAPDAGITALLRLPRLRAPCRSHLVRIMYFFLPHTSFSFPSASPHLALMLPSKRAKFPSSTTPTCSPRRRPALLRRLVQAQRQGGRPAPILLVERIPQSRNVTSRVHGFQCARARALCCASASAQELTDAPS